MQVRNIVNEPQNADATARTTSENGFEIRRTKFAFDGNAFTPDLTYNFQWETNQNGGAVRSRTRGSRYQFDAKTGRPRRAVQGLAVPRGDDQLRSGSSRSTARC